MKSLLLHEEMDLLEERIGEWLAILSPEVVDLLQQNDFEINPFVLVCVCLLFKGLEQFGITTPYLMEVLYAQLA